MKRFYYILILLLICGVATAAPPSRSKTYTSGETIKSSDVTENEDNIFNYLTAGVDTVKDGSIVNADVNNSANIQASKINLTSINQSISNTGTITATGAITSTGIVATTSLQATWGATRPATCSDGQLFVQTAASTGLYICIGGAWAENDND